jgi:hypothetical protein
MLFISRQNLFCLRKGCAQKERFGEKSGDDEKVISGLANHRTSLANIFVVKRRSQSSQM